MTKHLPAGTCNFALNMPVQVRLLLGGQAYADHTSTATLMWKLIEAGAKTEAPELGRKIAQQRRSIAKVICGFALIVSLGQQFFQRDESMVRASGRVSVMRGVRGGRKNNDLDAGAFNLEVA